MSRYNNVLNGYWLGFAQWNREKSVGFNSGVNDAYSFCIRDCFTGYYAVFDYLWRIEDRPDFWDAGRIVWIARWRNVSVLSSVRRRYTTGGRLSLLFVSHISRYAHLDNYKRNTPSYGENICLDRSIAEWHHNGARKSVLSHVRTEKFPPRSPLDNLTGGRREFRIDDNKLLGLLIFFYENDTLISFNYSNVHSVYNNKVQRGYDEYSGFI